MPLKITFKTDEVNNYLRVDTGIDTDLINGLVDTAKIEAEGFLNTDFADELYNEPQEAPAPVKTWVLSRTAQLYESRGQHAAPDYTLLKPHRIIPFRG